MVVTTYLMKISTFDLSMFHFVFHPLQFIISMDCFHIQFLTLNTTFFVTMLYIVDY
jgi:hypothetical protein